MAVLNSLPVAAVSIFNVIGDYEGNAERAGKVLHGLSGPRVVLFPEIATGYGRLDKFLQTGSEEREWELMERHILHHSHRRLIAWPLPVRVGGHRYNAVALLLDSKVLGVVPKSRLAHDSCYFEYRYFKAWGPNDPKTFVPYGTTKAIPFGEIVFDIDGVRFMVVNCEEHWDPSSVEAYARARGVDVVLNPNASHDEVGKHKLRLAMMKVSSAKLDCGWISANHNGCQDGHLVFGAGNAIAQCGEFLAIAERFTCKPVVITEAVFDIDEIRRLRDLRPSHDVTSPPYQEVVRTTADTIRPDGIICDIMPSISVEPVAEHLDPLWERRGIIEMALGGQLIASGCQGFALSLSGGKDSAQVAMRAWGALRRYWDGLGEERFNKSVRKPVGRTSDHYYRSVSEVVSDYLVFFYQETRNSTAETLGAAQGLAADLGARFYNLAIDEVVDSLNRTSSVVLGRELDWANERDDIALQNAQARVRGTIAWQIANMFNALLLATSTRDEILAKYWTKGGDDAGGYAPLCGVGKINVRRQLEDDLFRFGYASLRQVLDIPPTAELRPEALAQTDDSDLGPLELRAAIGRLLHQKKKRPIQVFRLLETAWVGREIGEETITVDRLVEIICDLNFRKETGQWARIGLPLGPRVEAEDLATETSNRHSVNDQEWRISNKELRDFLAELNG